jgi:hypothetical protein
MLNYQGIAHYQRLVRCGKDFGKDFYLTEFIPYHYRFLTDFITSYYRSLVRLKPLSIKALYMSLPILPIFNTYIAYNFLKEELWG